MHTYRYIVALTFAWCACGTTPEHPVRPASQTARTGQVTDASSASEPDQADAQSHAGRPPSQLPAMQPEVHHVNGETLHVYTYAAMARRLGIHQGFAELAGLGCSRQYQCNPDDLREGDTVHQCKVRLARVWCPPGICPDDMPDSDGPEWEECYRATYTRSCDRLDEPIACELLRERSMELRPTAWPLSGL